MKGDRGGEAASDITGLDGRVSPMNVDSLKRVQQQQLLQIFL